MVPRVRSEFRVTLITFTVLRSSLNSIYVNSLTFRVSKEEDSGKNHMIIDDGYNIGRDLLVDRATGGTHYRGKWWKADVEWNEQDLLEAGHKGA